MSEHIRKGWLAQFGDEWSAESGKTGAAYTVDAPPVPVLVIDNTPEARENQVGRAALIYVRNIDAEEDANEERRQRGEVQTWSSPHDRMAAVFTELLGPPVEPEP